MERYLARELTVAEADWFEAYVLAHPHLAEELEADEALRQMAAKPEIAQSKSAPTKRVQRPWLIPGAAAAAAVLAWVFFGVLHMQVDPAAGVQPAIYTLDAERGGSEVHWNLATAGGADTPLILLQIPARKEVSWLEVRSKSGAPMRLGPLVSDGIYFSVLIDKAALQGKLTLMPQGAPPVALPPVNPVAAFTP